MFQQCPICKGSGKIQEFGSTTCPTCDGKRIISQLTGLPPTTGKPKSTESYTMQTNIPLVNIPQSPMYQQDIVKKLVGITKKCSAECFCDGSCQKDKFTDMRNKESITDFLDQIFKA